MHGYFHSIFLVPKLFWYFVLGTCKFIPHRGTGGGGGGGGGWWVLMEPLPRVFDMLQYFKTILPLVESL